jgi:tetratricopeptide (TPR) repeat protein
MKYILNKWIFFVFVLTSSSIFCNQVTDSLYVVMLDAQGKKKVDLLNELSVAYRDNDNNESYEYAKEAYVNGKGFKYKKGIAESLMNIGFYHSTIGEYDISKTNFNKAMKLFRKLKDLHGEARVLINLGIINNFQGNLKDALIYLQKSLLLNKKINDSLGITKSCVNIGILYYSLKDSHNSLIYYLKALAIKKAIRDSIGIGLTYNNIGQIYCDQKKYQDALNYYYLAKNIFKKFGNKNQIAMIYNNISQVNMNLNNFQTSLKYQFLSLKIKNSINDNYGKSISYLNLGEIYLLLNDKIKSEKYLDSSLSLSQQIGDNIGIADAYNKLGNLNFLKKNYKNSIANYNKAIIHYQKSNMLEDKAQIYNLISDAYYQSGDINKAYDYKKLSSTLSDSLRQTENETLLYQTLAKLEAENYIEILKKDNEIKESKNTFLLISIASGVIIILTLTIGFFVIKSKNKKLEITISELEDMNKFQKDVYSKLTNDILSTLYPLSINIAKLSRVDEFEAINKSYLGFSTEYEKLLKTFKIHIDN